MGREAKGREVNSRQFKVERETSELGRRRILVRRRERRGGAEKSDRREAPPRHLFFSELHILKGFKCCVLKLRILQGLQARFAKVRIVKELGIGGVGWREEEKHGSEDPPLQKRGKRRGAEAPHLHRRGEAAHREGKTGGGEDDWPGGKQNIGKGSMGLARR
jgi:hypothetical protein